MKNILCSKKTFDVDIVDQPDICSQVQHMKRLIGAVSIPQESEEIQQTLSDGKSSGGICCKKTVATINGIACSDNGKESDGINTF